jgi:hypothetical protein
MCDNNCSCPCCCHKTVVCCGGGSAVTPPTQTPPSEQPPIQQPPGEQPPSQPTCTRALVRIDSIRVTKAESFGFFGEPGAAAEWFLTITVNDQSRTWANSDVRDGRDYPIGFDFPMDLINESATITIRTSGYEEDDTFACRMLSTS